MSTNVSKSILPISVVIPTFSEEKVLPRLLKSLAVQVMTADETIVADAFSPDRTRAIAEEYGCRVVDGGKIAEGRNAGARVARNDYILFLDGDTVLPTETILIEAFAEFLKLDADIASAGFKPDRVGSTAFGYAAGSVIYGSGNVARRLQHITKKVVHEGGAFILIKNSVFKVLNGFNEEMTSGEDGDLFVRAVKNGYKYAFLSQSVLTSTRRYETPKKAAKFVMATVFQAIMLGVGIYAGSAVFKKIMAKYYGKLGGGDGKDIRE